MLVLGQRSGGGWVTGVERLARGLEAGECLGPDLSLGPPVSGPGS